MLIKHSYFTSILSCKFAHSNDYWYFQLRREQFVIVYTLDDRSEGNMVSDAGANEKTI